MPIVAHSSTGASGLGQHQRAVRAGVDRADLGGEAGLFLERGAIAPACGVVIGSAALTEEAEPHSGRRRAFSGRRGRRGRAGGGGSRTRRTRSRSSCTPGLRRRSRTSWSARCSGRTRPRCRWCLHPYKRPRNRSRIADHFTRAGLGRHDLADRATGGVDDAGLAERLAVLAAERARTAIGDVAVGGNAVLARAVLGDVVASRAELLPSLGEGGVLTLGGGRPCCCPLAPGQRTQQQSGRT